MNSGQEKAFASKKVKCNREIKQDKNVSKNPGIALEELEKDRAFFERVPGIQTEEQIVAKGKEVDFTTAGEFRPKGP